MKLLGWDTSGKAGSIVAVECGPDFGSLDVAPVQPFKVVSEFTLNVDATHSERLLWGIHQVLLSARWSLQEVDAFAVGVGPGSFTGLRIGVTTARTLSHTLKKPLIPVSSLAALARPAALHYAQFHEKVLVVAVTDACKGELFALWGHADAVQKVVMPSAPVGSDGGLGRVREEVLTPEALIDLLQKDLAAESSPSRWVVLGEGVSRYSEIWQALPQAQKLECAFLFSDTVQGRYLGLMAAESLRSTQRDDALGVFPQYLRASDAELKLRAGQLPRVGSNPLSSA
jgi:tRNA threonylcarbamoyladenosine biosynthesis protein TsaB